MVQTNKEYQHDVAQKTEVIGTERKNGICPFCGNIVEPEPPKVQRRVQAMETAKMQLDFMCAGCGSKFHADIEIRDGKIIVTHKESQTEYRKNDIPQMGETEQYRY